MRTVTIVGDGTVDGSHIIDNATDEIIEWVQRVEFGAWDVKGAEPFTATIFIANFDDESFRRGIIENPPITEEDVYIMVGKERMTS